MRDGVAIEAKGVIPKFHNKELQRFVNMREKFASPVFVGRDILLQDILSIAKTTGEEGLVFRAA